MSLIIEEESNRTTLIVFLSDRRETIVLESNKTNIITDISNRVASLAFLSKRATQEA